MRNVLPDAKSFETAHVAENYPYGFRLRTKMFSWVEQNKNGCRLVQQTINPKNNKMNAPKKSTYIEFMLLGLDDNGHVTNRGYSKYSTEEAIQKFLDAYRDYMSESEIKNAEAVIRIKKMIGDRWEERERQAKEKVYISTDEIQPGQVILADQLKEYKGKIALWEINLKGDALLPRKRKESFVLDHVAYLKRDESLTQERAYEIMSQIKAEIDKKLTSYKSHKLRLSFEEVTLDNQDGLFSSMSRMLFSSEKIAIKL
jgi:hypothetical protein